MAVDLHDPSFFIPSSQDHHFDALQNNNINNKPYLFASSESGSGLSSPTGSDHLNSTITESSEEEEDCFIAELTRQMAQYMFQDKDKDKDKQDKSYGSPMVEKNEETAAYGHGRRNKAEDQASSKTRESPRGFNNGYHSNTPWHTLHQQQQQQQQQQKSKKQTGSDERAVFLTGSGSKNGSSGTGVFLPRATGGTPCNSRKKQGCATVLIPAKVQALKLHFEKTGTRSRFNTTDFNNGSSVVNSPQKGRSGRRCRYEPP
ncbi:hypothetical protein F3Y22_tig00111344pilonHSYRG00013 [Hibiscus syriacus]|uniref:Uncharacterized protein n=1 Tax=Hibiscus syriacus TaxID=106335 RepID=A0A6A2YNR8_HIBSY|nr:hypothetical protein F3Y22_tig00111344pilonHSYRG00013 [Hibiscus syriacus]